MKIVQKGLLTMALLLLYASIGNAGALDAFQGQKGILKIAGGTAHIPVMKEAAKQIMTTNPDIRITIAGGGSGVGIKQAGEGLVDIGNAGRKATDKEVSTYGLKMFKWAIDGVGVVVHPENPVTTLTTAELQDIFAGKITNWQEVGGADNAINLYGRDAGSGTRKVFWKKALKNGDISKKSNVVVSNGAMKSAVAGDPYAIGYVSIGHMGASVTPVAIDDIAPTLDNVKSGQYGVARGLYSLTKGEPEGLAKLFIDYLFSEQGQKIAAAKGFIPVQ